MTDPPLPARGDEREPAPAVPLVTVRARASQRGDGALDEQARGLLEANGVSVDPEGLRTALASPISILQGASARVLGAIGDRDAVPALADVLGDAARLEDVHVEAAYALARLGDPRGPTALRQALALPVEASPAPSQAAGALARLDDTSGWPVVEGALQSGNQVTAMVAVKQLPAFVHRPSLPDEDVWSAFATALSSEHPAVSAEARSQLSALDDPEAARLLGRGR